jgi:surface antigen
VLIRRLSLPAVLLALVVALAGLVAAPSADASSTLVCKGFTACRTAGYSSFGYDANYRKMWWRMYAGHNCTNYVSYRMVQNGMSSTRPWSGSGDARNWGKVFASKTNQTPMVGSVAWWSTNHVAYVQQVIDANTIVISEDHWGGDFDWRKIVRSGGGWPTGFIHLTDETFKATVAPAITGTPRVDVPLTATPGTWNIARASVTYQWLANGVAIPGATTSKYTPTAKQLATRLTVQVTAGRTGYRAGSSVSAVSAAVAPGTMRTTGNPTITGLAKVGSVLTVSGGSWTPAPTSTSIAWFSDGVAIPGATQATLKLTAAQLDHRITAVVTGRRAGYTNAAATSAATAPVGPEKLVVTREPSLTGTPHVGEPLTVTPGVVGPGSVSTTYLWMRDKAPIRDSNAARYVPTAKDLGSRLSVRVTYSQPGYTPVVRLLSLSAPVRSYATIKARSRAHRSITVSVEALGVPSVGGTVTLVSSRGERAKRELTNGQATFSPAWLRAGKRTFTVIFSGSFRVDARTTTRVVDVR